jgi:hypothetical protein
MATLTIEDVPDELCRTLKTIPVEQRRLVIAEVIACLEDGVRSCGRPREKITERQIREIRERRERRTLNPLTPEILEEAIAEGRP